mmetsp:Transcript_2202/g.5169  ORF Transcript_2202/g.5169 Transcript_2202/m.5169 type:complete len:227 (+) Transcript_2202:145-825(+)
MIITAHMPKPRANMRRCVRSGRSATTVCTLSVKTSGSKLIPSSLPRHKGDDVVVCRVRAEQQLGAQRGHLGVCLALELEPAQHSGQPKGDLHRGEALGRAHARPHPKGGGGHPRELVRLLEAFRTELVRICKDTLVLRGDAVRDADGSHGRDPEAADHDVVRVHAHRHREHRVHAQNLVDTHARVFHLGQRLRGDGAVAARRSDVRVDLFLHIGQHRGLVQEDLHR